MFRCASPPEELRRYAREVEAFGFHELWVVEDCFYGGGIASACAALAATDHLVVGLGIAPAVLRNPAALAMELATLARIYPDRLLPGIGHGVADWMRQVGAYPDSPLRALDEVTTVVRALLRGETVSVKGSHVHLDAVRLVHPPQSVPPVATGVRAEKSLRLSGRVADGTIVTELSSPPYLRWAREQIDAGRAEADRADPHRLTVYALFALDAKRSQARAVTRLEIAHALRSGGLGAQLRSLGIESQAAELTASARDERALAAALPDEWVSQLAVAGDAADCAEAVLALRAAGADAVVLVPIMPKPLDQLATAARTVLPLVR
jgi:alkanesulfonate monooxygenase SsuD/methylene tetrahydromethanopterin reductase-like flavin-dependent oxidoreductase (luciferase family)